MLPFIRSEVAELAAYLTDPGSKADLPLDKLDANESPYNLPAQYQAKLAWIYQHQIKANRYPDDSHNILKAAIATYVNQSANLPPQTFTPTNISVGNGSDELIRALLIATCLGGEGSVLVANPTFSVYEIMSQTLGIPVHKVQRSEADFALDIAQGEQILSQNDDPPVRVVFVVHPNSPTGNLLTETELSWLKSLGTKRLVVIDEAYFEYSQTTVVSELLKRPNWLVLRTFSKAFRLAAHRVGYAIADPELIAALEKVRLPYNLPTLSQAAALLALRERPQILDSIAETLRERDQLYQNLCQYQELQVWASAANFVYLRPQSINIAIEQLRSQLKTLGTLVRHTGGGIRITVGSPAENARTISRLKQVLSLLTKS